MRNFIKTILLTALSLFLSGCLGLPSNNSPIAWDEAEFPIPATFYAFDMLSPIAYENFKDYSVMVIKIGKKNNGYVIDEFLQEKRNRTFPRNTPFAMKSLGDNFYLMSIKAKCKFRSEGWCNFLTMLDDKKIYVWTDVCAIIKHKYLIDVKNITGVKACEVNKRKDVMKVFNAIKKKLMLLDESDRHHTADLRFSKWTF